MGAEKSPSSRIPRYAMFEQCLCINMHFNCMYLACFMYEYIYHVQVSGKARAKALEHTKTYTS